MMQVVKGYYYLTKHVMRYIFYYAMIIYRRHDFNLNKYQQDNLHYNLHFHISEHKNKIKSLLYEHFEDNFRIETNYIYNKINKILFFNIIIKNIDKDILKNNLKKIYKILSKFINKHNNKELGKFKINCIQIPIEYNNKVYIEFSYKIDNIDEDKIFKLLNDNFYLKIDLYSQKKLLNTEYNTCKMLLKKVSNDNIYIYLIERNNEYFFINEMKINDNFELHKEYVRNYLYIQNYLNMEHINKKLIFNLYENGEKLYISYTDEENKKIEMYYTLKNRFKDNKYKIKLIEFAINDNQYKNCLNNRYITNFVKKIFDIINNNIYNIIFKENFYLNEEIKSYIKEFTKKQLMINILI